MEINNEQKEQVKKAVKATVVQPPYLLVVFVLLKAFNVISWSWTMTILFPILLPFAIVFGILAIVGIIFGIVMLGAVTIDAIGRQKRKFRRRK